MNGCKLLHRVLGARSAVEGSEVEQRIGSLINTLRNIDAKLAADRRQISQLRARSDRERVNLQSQSRALVQQVRATFAMGRQEYLKLLR